METPTEVQQEEVKDEVDNQPEAKPAVKKAAPKNNSSKKTSSNKKNVKSKITDEIFNEITRRNNEEGIPFHVLCAEYNVSESSLNYRRAKMREADNVQKPATKQKATAKPRESFEQVKIGDLVSQLNLLKEMHMDLLLKYNQLLREK